MNTGLNPDDPALVAAFRSALEHQGAIIGVIFLLLLLAWGATRGWVTASTQARAALAATWREPRARRLLRVGFGILWLFDGILQAQPQMPGGLPSQVIQPAASTSPGWVQHLVNAGGSIWTYHPIEAAAASVWIQVGIGMWLIFAVRGWSSRLAGLASVAWGLIVWAFGEAFGAIFAPGLTVLFGAPGAVLIYAVAGALVALPERAWGSARPGRLILAGTGVFFLGMALLQAWPGRGFWQGTLHGQPGSLTGMVQTMAGTSQPHVLSALVSSFADFTAAHGWGVNLFAVIAVAGLGATFCVSAVRGDARLARIGVIAGAVLCLADWVLIEDLGFLGGLGTDPNSMIPLILLFTAGWLALTPTPQPAPATMPAGVVPVSAAGATAQAAVTVPAVAAEGAAIATAQGREATAQAVAGTATQQVTASAATSAGPEPVGGSQEGAAPVDQAAADAATPETSPVDAGGGSGAAPPVPPSASAPRPIPSWVPAALHPDRLRESLAASGGRAAVALAAIAVILVGAAPMALASVNHDADPIVAEAIAGASGQLDTPAPNFTLTSQDGRQVSLAGLRGKVVLLTFLDPVCTTDCPIIAQEMRAADAELGGKAASTELVAVVANPTYTSTAFTQAFTRQEGLDQVPNWLYLTGSLSQLQAVWQHYGIDVEDLPAGAMTAHNDLVYVIDAAGNAREEINSDPGAATDASKSSFASLFVDDIRQVMGQGQ
ncbi:MAG TPA: SCO family protein [Trebonia sp.]|nr:SCO family protein [Trebonia sp.]